MPRALRLQPAALAAAVLSAALVTAAAPAFARDPAYVGGGYDPANVGSRPRQARPAVRIGMDMPMPDRDEKPKPTATPATAGQIQALLERAAAQSDDYDGGMSYRERREFDAIRDETQKLAELSWDRLSPTTRQLYRDALEQAERMAGAEAMEERRYYNREDAAAALGRSMRESREAMQQMEEVLLPMLQDVKRSFDAELRNAAGRRR